MDIAEMHIGVKLLLDKITSSQLPSFQPEEIDWYLNKAIQLFVKTRVSGSNVKGESFEQTSKRLADLRGLVVQTYMTGNLNLPASAAYKPNSYVYPLPSTDYYLTVDEEAVINITSTNTNLRTGVTECTSDTYNEIVDNPFSEHRLYLGKAKPLRLYTGWYVELITDGNYTVVDYYIRYVKKPAEVSLSSSISCDLPEHTHQEILDICVNLMLENIESTRYQSFKQETMISE